MDTEQHLRFGFLEEAEEYFNNLESLLMDLEAQGAEPNLLDTAMRAAHSLKGGAAMMQFPTLSKIAHRLEDFLKILRVRKDDTLVDREIATLLLQGVDCLRNVTSIHQQESFLNENWFDLNANPVFNALRARLGDLSEEDEDLLLAEEEKVDVSKMLFQSGVEDCLESFKAQIDILEPARLKEELSIQVEQLIELGQMSQIEPFVLLSQSIEQQLNVVSLNRVRDLAHEAFKLWERSHALVLVGRIDKLPTQLGSFNEAEFKTTKAVNQPDISDIVDSAELTAIQQFTAQELALDSTADLDSDLDLDEFIPDAAELSELDAAFATVNELEAEALVTPEASTPDLDEFIPDAAELSELDAAFAEIDRFEAEAKPSCDPDEKPEAEVVTTSPTLVSSEQPKRDKGRMIRIPAEQLENLNNLSSKLILERNAAILRLNQLQNFVDLTRERMRRLEKYSHQLRQLYDWASLEGMMPTTSTEPVTTKTNWQPASYQPTPGKFDALEMDRYNDLHLLSQSQMETIVQLQEVTADMDLGVREMGQVIRDFSYTTRELQQNITRSQMRPFSELVGRFPRLIRDLSNQHNKQVDLKIEGETTYIDRQALELLSDPLTHLLRNAFDHGLEDSDTRLARGKSATGQIILKAVQKGNQTIITIADDGGGIDTRKIGDRLLKMGFTPTEVAQIPEADLLDAIFEPGFSTAERVTELSGRGVGMDVVRSNLQQIRGDIQVTTELGKGTKFTISVPLSLLVLRVVIVETAGMIFAIPVHSIKEIIQFDPDLVIQSERQEQIHWGEKSATLIRLENYFQFKRPNKPFEMEGTAKIPTPTILVFEDNDIQQGIYLEKYWNEQEVAIRPIQTSIPLFPGLTGSTVLGDGRVIPLIELSTLSKNVTTQANKEVTSADTNIDDVPSLIFPVSSVSTILIVDDSVNVRRYLAVILEHNGYQVEEAKDGRDAVEKLLGGLKVEAIICDVEMPRLDGYGVLSEVKAEPHLEHIPIAMLTSRSNDKHRQLAMKLGASAYFSKPFNEQQMLQTLASLITQ